MGLRLQGGARSERRRGGHRLLPGPRQLRREAHRRGPHSARPPRRLPLADKGFSSLAWERRCLQEHDALVAATPKENSRRAWPQEACRWAAGKRQIIESVIGQLKDLFSLERHRAKTLGGLLARLSAKVAAYTCGQRLNALARETVALPGRSAGLNDYASVVLELPPIGRQLFILGSAQSDSTTFPSFCDTYATRLLAQPLRLSSCKDLWSRLPSMIASRSMFLIVAVRSSAKRGSSKFACTRVSEVEARRWAL